MAVFFITGKLGGGKTLVSVGRIRDYLLAGKKVATNLNLNLEHLIPRSNKSAQIFRIPDKPTLADLEAIGYGSDSNKDETFGLLVLDELGTWLNSRTFQSDKSRQPVIDWFIHSRKMRWDVLLIVQNIELIDKQVRISMGEHIAICRRTDRIPLPVISTLFKMFTGKILKFPRIHVASVFYGDGLGAVKVDTWVYRGNDLFKAYDTAQIFQSNENRISQFIPPGFLNNKRFAIKNKRFYMRLTKIYLKKYKAPMIFLSGLAFNFFLIFILWIFYGGNVSANVPSVADQADQSTSDQADQADQADQVDQAESVLQRLPYTRRYQGKYTWTTFYLDGVPYDSKKFPHKVTWINNTPYYYSIVDNSNSDNSNSDNSIDNR